MSKSFTVNIQLGNAEMLTGPDVAGALRQVARAIGGKGELDFDGPSRIFDINGNTVGTFSVTGADDLGVRT